MNIAQAVKIINISRSGRLLNMLIVLLMYSPFPCVWKSNKTNKLYGIRKAVAATLQTKSQIISSFLIKDDREKRGEKKVEEEKERERKKKRIRDNAIHGYTKC